MQLTTEAFFRKPSHIISRDILKEASLAMSYWATDLKPDLTHGSIMKKWSSHARFSFQNTIRWCQNLLLLNYSYAFEILNVNFWFNDRRARYGIVFSICVWSTRVSTCHISCTPFTSNFKFVVCMSHRLSCVRYVILLETKPNNKWLYSYHTPCFSVDGHISVSLCSQNFNFN